jgi:hypothetical protein
VLADPPLHPTIANAMVAKAATGASLLKHFICCLLIEMGQESATEWSSNREDGRAPGKNVTIAPKFGSDVRPTMGQRVR